MIIIYRLEKVLQSKKEVIGFMKGFSKKINAIMEEFYGGKILNFKTYIRSGEWYEGEWKNNKY